MSLNLTEFRGMHSFNSSPFVGLIFSPRVKFSFPSQVSDVINDQTSPQNMNEQILSLFSRQEALNQLGTHWIP